MAHTTAVRKMEANEGGRGNLAGFEISCSCGFVTGTTLACDVQNIQVEHIEVMTRIDVERSARSKKALTAAKRAATIAHNKDPFGFAEELKLYRLT
jgi:hypothetical protein